MDTEKRHLGIQIDKDLHYKLTYALKYHGRTLSGTIVRFARKYVEDFEAKNGEIELPPSLKK